MARRNSPRQWPYFGIRVGRQSHPERRNFFEFGNIWKFYVEIFKTLTLQAPSPTRVSVQMCESWTIGIISLHLSVLTVLNWMICKSCGASPPAYEMMENNSMKYSVGSFVGLNLVKRFPFWRFCDLTIIFTIEMFSFEATAKKTLAEKETMIRIFYS